MLVVHDGPRGLLPGALVPTSPTSSTWLLTGFSRPFSVHIGHRIPARTAQFELTCRLSTEGPPGNTSTSFPRILMATPRWSAGPAEVVAPEAAQEDDDLEEEEVKEFPQSPM